MDGIQFNVADCGEEIRFIHREGMKAFLPQVTATSFAEVHMTGLLSVSIAKGGAQSSRRFMNSSG